MNKEKQLQAQQMNDSLKFPNDDDAKEEIFTKSVLWWD